MLRNTLWAFVLNVAARTYELPRTEFSLHLVAAHPAKGYALFKMSLSIHVPTDAYEFLIFCPSTEHRI